MTLKVTSSDDDFWQFIHMHSLGYDFPGGYRLRPGVGTGLWYVTDSISYRLTAEGVWVGSPTSAEAHTRWVQDTSHEFKDAYELLSRHIPAPRPAPARVP